jgi:general stress protein 26
MRSGVVRHVANHASAERTIDELVADIEIAMLVSLSPDGESLVSRPLVTLQIDAAGHFWFFIRSDSGKVDDVSLHAMVNLAYADPVNRHYVSVVGRASVVEDRRHIKELWTPRAAAYFPQGVADPSICLLKVEPESAEHWQAEGGFAHGRVALGADRPAAA